MAATIHAGQQLQRRYHACYRAAVVHQHIMVFCQCRHPRYAWRTIVEAWVDDHKWMQLMAALTSILSGLYVGWPLFRWSIGETTVPAIHTLSKVMPTPIWGCLLLLSGICIFIALLEDWRPLKRFAAHANLTIWGSIVFLLWATRTSGLAVPLGTAIVVSEFRRMRRLGKERRAPVEVL